MRPEEPENVSDRARRVFRAAYAEGSFRCSDCRYKTANEQLERYLAHDSWPEDPLLWVAEVTAAGLPCDYFGIVPVPERDYDPIPNLLRFVRTKVITPISCRLDQPEDRQPGPVTSTGSVTGWLVKRGGLYSSGFSDPEYGFYPPDECPILVSSDGRCFALRAKGRGAYEVVSEAFNTQVGAKAEGRGSYSLNSPYVFLEAAKELAVQPK